MHAGKVKFHNGLTIDVEHFQKSGQVSLELGRAGQSMGFLFLRNSREEVLASLDELRAIVAALPAQTGLSPAR
ncbi:hypothetical protein [Ralstonia pseudosolanacearum]|uniref:hypothetical protein n=1 Tax=Ralstonia pseudosolanacearum TaxID=1310165 RepID=UPI003CEBB724